MAGVGSYVSQRGSRCAAPSILISVTIYDIFDHGEQKIA